MYGALSVRGSQKILVESVPSTVSDEWIYFSSVTCRIDTEPYLFESLFTLISIINVSKFIKHRHVRILPFESVILFILKLVLDRSADFLIVLCLQS